MLQMEEKSMKSTGIFAKPVHTKNKKGDEQQCKIRNSDRGRAYILEPVIGERRRRRRCRRDDSGRRWGWRRERAEDVVRVETRLSEQRHRIAAAAAAAIGEQRARQLFGLPRQIVGALARRVRVQPITGVARGPRDRKRHATGTDALRVHLKSRYK